MRTCSITSCTPFQPRLAEVSQSLALVLVGDFNLRKQPRRFLECVEDNFLIQLANESIGGGASLHLLFTHRE